MANFFKINNKSVSEPTSISISFDNLDKEERTMDGTMVVDIVGVKKKISVAWDYLTKENMTLLTTEANSNTFVSVSAHDNSTGELVTIVARVKDFTFEPQYDWANAKLLWKSVKINFVER